MSECPVTCTLTSKELTDRRQQILSHLQTERLEMKELADGLAFRFAASSRELTALTNIIDLERQCCQFLTFRLIVEPQLGSMWLELIGPPGTKEMLVAELGVGS